MAEVRKKVDPRVAHATIVSKFYPDGSYSVEVSGDSARVTQRILERASLDASRQISVIRRVQHRLATQAQSSARKAEQPVDTNIRPTQEYPTNG